MITLLDDMNQRRLAILNLLVHETEWVTVGEIAQRIGASERTVQSDLTQMKNEWDARLCIEVSLKNGVLLGCRSSTVVHTAFMDAFKQSIALRFLRDLVLAPSQNLDFYISKLFISKSTFLRLLPKIEEYLGKIQIRIDKTGGKYKLCGENEQHMRKLLAEFYLEVHSECFTNRSVHMELRFASYSIPVNLERVFDIVRAMIAQIQNSERAKLLIKDELAISEMSAFLLCSLLRENQGVHIDCPVQPAGDIRLEDFQYLHSIFPAIKTEHIRPIQEFFAEVILEPKFAELAASVQYEALTFYHRLFQQMNISCSPVILRKLQTMLCLLYSYVSACPLSLDGLPKRLSSFSASLATDNPCLYEAISSGLSTFSEHLNVDMTPILPEFIMKICFYFPDISRATLRKSLLVVSDSGLYHARFLADFIRSLFNGSTFSVLDIHSISLDAFRSPAFAQQCAQYYHILVTTTAAIPHQQLFQKVIMIEDFPSSESVWELHEVIYHSDGDAIHRLPHGTSR